MYIVPGSQSGWQKRVDVGKSTFELSAPLTLPATIKSADVAQIRAAFNDAVDTRSVDSLINEDFTKLTISGRTSSGRGLGQVELVQVILERSDGKFLVQNLSIGL